VESIGNPALWTGFLAFVAAMLALDLFVFHRASHEVRFREAAAWSAVWVGLALAFGAGVWTWAGREAGLLYLTGYVVEKSLSVDNIFVFVVVFSTLGIPSRYQHRILFWGVLSALVLRAVMIFAGVALLDRFHWLVYAFGAVLVITGVRLFLTWRSGGTEGGSERRLLAWVRRVLPTTERLDGQRFVTLEAGRRVATPLLLALVLVEVTDVIFAVDSIPAILAITTDPFLVFTSNIFAILGLRSLYFLLAGLVDRFSLLKLGLSAVLVFVGVKMTLVDVVHVPPAASLAVISLLLGASVAGSLARRRPLP
jgi:tellurite resistance protein TerC